ncbi:hypothetical protein [Dyella sp. SG609]|uniref:hypothetical protein n=1 Tax=Dyella sp. SG609 TaxID=2587018 RepID=UPI0014457CA0|nr:hypothetical protein [Dyella sp. SG609]NKJ21976.1 hypothetical protein [Dyella sp. SG609]
MQLTAAPIVRQPMHVVGAPGKTDFVRIYLASELNKSEYRTTLRHEQGHVWSAHNRRRPKEAIQELWVIACEMEIARTIYDQTDIDNINAPRSRLAGGYLPGSIKGLPDDVVLAEDIYEWLVTHPEQKPSMQCCGCGMGDGDSSDSEEIDGGAVSIAAREKLDSDERQKESQVAAEASYALLKNRTPSLTCAVDAALRVRIERERSYRRPSRRYDNVSLLPAGSISTPRPPLVEIFVDRSGSFTPQKTRMAEQRLKELLARYGSSIRSDVWFFGNGKLSDKDYGGGGDTPYQLIPAHLQSTKPKLAIIITDDDPVSDRIGQVDRSTSVICVPIGCDCTNLARVLRGTDVAQA